MSRATTLVSVNQQLAVSAGVAVGAFSVESTMWCATSTELSCDVISRRPSSWSSIISTASAYFFWQMPDDAGHEISGRKAVEISSRKEAAEGRWPNRRERNRRTRGISGWGRCTSTFVMPGLDPGIHVFLDGAPKQDAG